MVGILAIDLETHVGELMGERSAHIGEGLGHHVARSTVEGERVGLGRRPLRSAIALTLPRCAPYLRGRPARPGMDTSNYLLGAKNPPVRRPALSVKIDLGDSVTDNLVASPPRTKNQFVHTL